MPMVYGPTAARGKENAPAWEDASAVGNRMKVNEERLIRRQIDPNWDRYPGGRADARLRDFGVPV